jgi:sugar phosphate permease
VVPNVIADDLSRALNASAGTLGTIAAAYFYAYAVLQIPVGLMVDRYGTRWPMVVAIMVAGLGTLAFSWAHTPESALIARVAMGASSAFSFICCLKLVQEWFPPARFSTLAGMTNTAAMFGGAAGAPVAMLVRTAGWRAAVGMIGGAELVLAVLVFLIVRDRPMASTEPESEPAHATSSSGAGGLQKKLAGEPPALLTTPSGGAWGLLKNPQVWINAVYATSISLVFVAFGGLWGAGYIEKAYQVDAVTANGVSSLLFFGGIAGSLFFGWYSDYLGRRKSPMVQAGIGALATMACLLYVPGLPLMGFKAGLFLVGFFSSANIISYAVARDLYPKLAGLSIGFLSTCFYAGSASSQPLVGMLLERANSGGPGAGLAALTAGDYRFAFSPLVGFMLVGLIASLLARDPLGNPPRR